MSTLVGKDVVTLFVVEQRVGTDAWEKCALYVNQLWGIYANVKDVISTLEIAEGEVKDYFSITTLPTAWRTAKSTALNALKAGVPLLAEDGSVLSKSQVRENTRAAKAPKTAPEQTAEFFMNRLRVMVRDARQALSPGAMGDFLYDAQVTIAAASAVPGNNHAQSV